MARTRNKRRGKRGGTGGHGMTILGTRRQVLGGMAGAAALAGGAARAQGVAAPASPLTLSIVDVAGNLALTRPAFEDYRRKNPKLVGRIVYSQAPAPELPGKLRAQQAAGRVDIDMVLTGTDALAAGMQTGVWEGMAPHMAKLPDLKSVLLPGALAMQALAQDQAIICTYCPAGPLLEYLPDRVKQVPTTAEELLAYARANPGRFIYARPANSGPGRAFLMGLPYILGDASPKDPMAGWDKTWAYLAALGENVEYYPSGTGAVMKELGEGSRDMTVTITGWDINPRALGTVPKTAMVGTLKGFHFVNDAHFMALPKGLAAERQAVLLDLVGYLLSKEAQAFTYDAGYFYPGPAVRGVPPAAAPQESQDTLREFGRDFYDKLIADTPNETPLEAGPMVQAFRRWDEQVGAKVKR
jgi:putative spermidine/putrescine transport system substrate-binding protein